MTPNNTTHWIVLAGYNVLLLAWILDFYRTPYDIAYLYVVEAAVVGACAFFLALTAAPLHPVLTPLWLLAALGIAGLFYGVIYLMLWLVDSIPIIEAHIGGNNDVAWGPGLDQPLALLTHVWRPATIWVLPIMLGGSGFLFVRRHIKPVRTELDVHAVVGHAVQRMTMLFFTYGLCIVLVIVMKTAVGIIYGVLIAKITWDFFENTRWFDPYNILGAKTLWRRGFR